MVFEIEMKRKTRHDTKQTKSIQKPMKGNERNMKIENMDKFNGLIFEGNVFPVFGFISN